MKAIILAASLLVTGACGSSEPVHQGTINGSGARTSIESVNDVFSAMDAADGSGAASAVMALTAAGQIVVTPGTARQAPPDHLMPAAWPRDKTSRSFTGSAECTATGCTFDNFGDAYDGASYRINGSIQRTGDLLTFDLTYDITSAGLAFHWALDGRVRVNATLIDGDVHSHGDAEVTSEGRSHNVSWDFDLEYAAIGLDASGCPISGSLSATVGYAVSGAQSGSYRAGGRVTFGPTCGQFGSN